MKKIALFDLDKTLYNGFSMVEFVFKFVIPNNLTTEEKINKGKKLLADFTNQKISYNEATAKSVELIGEILKGKTVEEVKEWQKSFFKPEKLFPYALGFIKYLKEQKIEVYIISASVKPIVEHVSDYLGVKSFSSEVEVIDGSYSGRVINTLNEGKKAEVVEKIKINNPDSTLFGFGDSPGDINLLENVDYGFLVEPTNKELIKMAQKRNWIVVTNETIIEEFKKIEAQH